MMMTREFLPIGQGAFYTEQFHYTSGGATVLYDCGSSTSVRLVEQMIRQRFEPGEDIAGVFISHFDDDHTNAIPYLLQYCRVKNLFFPLLTNESREFLSLTGLINPKPSFASSFVQDPYRTLDSLHLDDYPRLYQIQEYTENLGQENPQSSIDASQVPSGSDLGSLLFSSAQRKELEWQYIPFNFRETARTAALKKAMELHLGRTYTGGELKDLLQRGAIGIGLIKQLYDAVPGSFNTNSMTLLSASPDGEIMQRPSALSLREDFSACARPSPCRKHFRCSCLLASPSGCLYTGDYDASGPQKWRELYSAYGKYSHCIGSVQIPHHGSSHNYNPRLLHIGDCFFCIISAGSRNRYHHPNPYVIKDILANRRYPLLVTEDSGETAFDVFAVR
ncbi:MAG: MBL fold metallo-hydrolase [Oscillibacter sp.]|nr:MBL fold metallo-hydrolase [Oscillibacter sp.]